MLKWWFGQIIYEIYMMISKIFSFSGGKVSEVVQNEVRPKTGLASLRYYLSCSW